MDKSLLYAGLSATIETEISEKGEGLGIKLLDLHQLSLCASLVGESSNDENSLNCGGEIHLKTLTGKTISIPYLPDMCFNTVKAKVNEKIGIEPNLQIISFGGKRIRCEEKLSDYNIQKESTLHLEIGLLGGGNSQPFFINEDILSPQFNYDFTNIIDVDQFSRGGENYIRPCGWMRFALRVKEYENDEKWIGCNNGVGEWPVSYHATGQLENKSIAENGYLSSKGKKLALNYGYYTTPSFKFAQRFAKTFTHQGSNYLAVIQNRVNPKTLIKIPKSQSNEEEYWVSPKNEDIRPYGICVKKIN
ncbi:hypothetical protein ACTA71_009267 [Dictyostelium dimigraforme]